MLSGLLAPVTDDQGEEFRRDLSPYPAALLELLSSGPAPDRGGGRAAFRYAGPLRSP